MDETTRTFPARVVVRATPADIAGLDLPEGAQPFVMTAEIASNRLDAYYGHMADSTLRNFAGEAAEGVAFLDSHNHFKLGLGYTFTGKYEAQGEVARVVSDIYTVPGIRFGGSGSYASTDDFIQAVKSRLARDVSVGFYGGEEICDICGKPVWSFRAADGYCPHIPGLEYAIGEQGEKTLLATFTVDDAHLAEVSAVYDGATPGAMIEKVRSMAAAGQLDGAAIHQFETRYRIKLPGRQLWPGVEIKDRSKTMPQEEILEPMEQIRAVLAEAGAPAELAAAESAAEGVRWLAERLSEATTVIEQHTQHVAEHAERVRGMQAEIDRLQPLADDGRAYRADLVDQAICEGVRAMGAGFPEETYRGMLEGVPLEHIKRIRDTFAEQAGQRFPGGRQSVDEEQKPQQQPVQTPDIAYAA
jgi:hypothetical protein